MSFSFSNPLVKSTLGLLIVTLLVKVAGYGEKLVLAYYFGTSAAADVYMLVFALILAFFFFFREIVEPVMLNVFMRGEKEASWQAFNYMLRIMLVTTLVLVLVSILFPAPIIHLFAPGFKAENTSLAITLFRIAVPAIVFLSLSTLTNIVLNAQKIFVFPMLGDLAFKALSILCMVLLANQFGIVSGAIGIALGALVKLVVQGSKVYKEVRFSGIEVGKSSKNKMWLLAWPLIIGMFFSQFTTLIDNIFASFMEKGSIAALTYARKVVELPIMMFPYVLSVVIFPYFTQLSSEQNHQKSMELLFQSMRWIVIVFVPLTIYFLFFSGEIVGLIFRRGAFDANSTALTGGALLVYSIGLLFFAIESVLVIFYYANADTKTPIFAGIACVLVNVATTYALIPSLGYLAIAAALVVQKGLKVFVLVGFLGKKLPVDYARLVRFAGRIVMPALLFTSALGLVKFWFMPGTVEGFVKTSIYLSGSLLASGIVYVLALRVFRVIHAVNFSKFSLR